VSESTVRVLVRRLESYPAEWALPSYATSGSAALDLRNAGPAIVLKSLGRQLVPTGLAIALPEGYEAQVRPRSGLASKQGITLINTPGTIDSDYRGELLVPLVNLDASEQRIEHGDRIAQLLLSQVLRISWEEAAELPPSGRGTGGFGSTGR
jgi:dUTP pyrophosphatase